MKHRKIIILVGCAFLWIFINIIGIFYGTSAVPLHQSYVGDEQSPINGALHILQDKSLLALRNQPNLYYGPIFSIVALPAVVFDFGIKYLHETVSGAESYKNHILYDWGGILIWARTIATIAGFIGLIGIYRLFSTQTLYVDKKIRWVAVALVAANYYYFEYNHFFKHWVFVVAICIWQLVLMVRILETDRSPKKLYLVLAFLTLASFGISYMSIVYQIIWLPVILPWFFKKDWSNLKIFALYVLGVVLGSLLIIAWHPYAFTRLLAGNAFIVMSQEVSAWGYYFKLLFLNHLPLFIAFVLMVWCSGRKILLMGRSNQGKVFYACVLAAVLNYVLFALQVRAEGRYMLPTIIYGIIAGVVLFGQTKNDLSLAVVRIIKICVVLTLVSHVVSIVGWNIVYSKGPIEQRFIKTLQREYQENNEARFLVVTDYLLGTVHSKEAYAAYASSTEKSDLNLFRGLLESDPPSDITPLPIFYYLPPHLYNDRKMLYDFLLNPVIDQKLVPKGITHIYVRKVNRIEPNQFDFFDEDITRIWYFDDLYYTYYRLMN